MSKILLGISESHNATAALFIDGRLISCIQEERLIRKKNIGGFPIESVNYLLKMYNISPENISGLCIANESPTNHFTWRENGNRHLYTKGIKGVGRTVAGLPVIANSSHRLIKNIMDETAVRLVFPAMRKKQISEIQNCTGIAEDKIRFVNHHTAHAWANVYFLPPDKRNLNYLVITSDGVGDRLSATINTYQDLKMERVESVSYHDSIALFYQHVTGFMGMKECEHEYKIMGLAPYADKNLAIKAFDKIRHLFRIDNTNLHCKVYVANHYPFLGKTMANTRFDAVAAAAQTLVEEVTAKWIRNIVKTYSIPNLVLGGGLFMNVKINKLLRELP
jgi:carbamoyltransferase